MEGIMKTKEGIGLWNKAKGIIPGGTQLLSKRAEMFLLEKWSSYFKKFRVIIKEVFHRWI